MHSINLITFNMKAISKIIILIVYSFIDIFINTQEANVYIKEILTTSRERTEVSPINASYEGSTVLNIKGYNFNVS